MKNKEIRALARKNLGNGIFKEKWLLALVVCIVFDILIALGPIGLIIGGPISAGFYLIFKEIAENKDEKVDFNKLFKGFDDFGKNLILYILANLFIILWTLLLIVPGIIKSYAYRMIYYIRNDEPELEYNEVIKKSQEMMKGNKWKLFLLDFSFLGWMIVGILTLGIGLFWVMPYMKAAEANFYLSIKNKEVAVVTEE